jgi:hypothetical protein
MVLRACFIMLSQPEIALVVRPQAMASMTTERDGTLAKARKLATRLVAAESELAATRKDLETARKEVQPYLVCL